MYNYLIHCTLEKMVTVFSNFLINVFNINQQPEHLLFACMVLLLSGCYHIFSGIVIIVWCSFEVYVITNNS